MFMLGYTFNIQNEFPFPLLAFIKLCIKNNVFDIQELSINKNDLNQLVKKKINPELAIIMFCYVLLHTLYTFMSMFVVFTSLEY